MSVRFSLLMILVAATAAAQQAPPPCVGLPPGKHALLERMTVDFGLTCEQELKIEPRLHDEESVTKPLLKFVSFSADEAQAVMVKIKLAARRQIRPLLTPDQQEKLDMDMANVAKSGRKAAAGGKNGATPATGPSFDDEQTLSKAIMNYAALTPEEKKALILQIKRAARADGNLRLTADQQKTLDAEIAALNKH